jgi:hypothetical protein
MPTEPIVALLLAERDRLNRAIEALREPVSYRRPPSNPTPDAVAAQPKKRDVSAASRRRMALAQKKRWAAIKAQSTSASETARERPKRRISPEGMKRIIAATKKRWALKRAEEAKLNRGRRKKTAGA